MSRSEISFARRNTRQAPSVEAVERLITKLHLSVRVAAVMSGTIRAWSALCQIRVHGPDTQQMGIPVVNHRLVDLQRKNERS